MAKKGLGRGLDALLADNDIDSDNSSGINVIRLSDIEPNREQARKKFDESPLLELADSISKHGVLQPIAVRRKSNGYYEIIAGERRWRASKIAGLSEIPAVVIEADDKTAAELSLVENLQREDLNPVEQAKGYRDLMQKFGLTQEQAAERVGKSRTDVANTVRLLKLPDSVLALVEDSSLSYGHARALIPLLQKFNNEDIKKYAQKIASDELSVRQTEELVKILLSDHPAEKKPSAVSSAYYKTLERGISDSLGRKARIKKNADGKGQLSLSFSGTDDLEQLIKSLCGNDFFETEK